MRDQIANAAAWTCRRGEELLDLLFPPRCAGCGRQGEAFCARCLSSIHFIKPPFCARCGGRLVHGICSDCTAFPGHALVIRSVGYHEGALREAIHALKYKRRRDVAPILASLLADFLERQTWSFDLIAPVPLHASRESERGYNQSELLARALSLRSLKPYGTILERTRSTADQIGLDLAARHANVRDAFRARPDACCGRRVLLIDDVCTTGATLDACAAALQAEGAQAVFGLTVARPS